MIELTICSNSLNTMEEARRRKEGKENYQSLLSDLCMKGLNASYLHISKMHKIILHTSTSHLLSYRDL